VKTGVSEFHSSAITGNDILVDPREVKNLKESLMAYINKAD
jgi:hypothetical protein